MLFGRHFFRLRKVLKLKRKAIHALLLIILVVLEIGLINLPEISAQNSKPVVVSTLPMLNYIAELVGGNYIKAISAVPQGANPETYEPSPQDLKSIVSADIILASGLHHTKLEEILERYVSEGKIKGVYLDANTYKLYGLKLIEIDGKPSPHGFWWNPKGHAAVALALGNTLARKDPSHANYYKVRAEEIAEEALKYSDSLSGLNVATYSPPDMYFADGCGANVVLLLTPNPSSTPTPDKIRELLSSKSSIDVLIVSSVDLRMSKGARSLIKKFEESGGKVAIVPLGAPGWDPLSSIIAGVWIVHSTANKEGSFVANTMGSCPLSYEDLVLVFIVGIIVGVGVMVAWARRVCGYKT